MSKFTFQTMPPLRLLTDGQIEQIHEQALRLLEKGTVAFAHPKALDFLEAAGCLVDRDTMKARIPRSLVEASIVKAPETFPLFDREGNFYCEFGDGTVRYNPGSCTNYVLNSDGKTIRNSGVQDLILLTQLAQHLPAMDFVSSSVVCSEAPASLGAQYIYYAEIRHSTKPIIGGSVDEEGAERTFHLLQAIRGSEKAAMEKPYTVFDVCAVSPLTWSHTAARNLMDCARLHIPMQLISSQISGATAPVTLAGAVLLHTVEVLSGLVLSQLVRPGAPVAFGGAPCVFNMKTLYTPMANMEAGMVSSAYGVMGKYYGLPIHTYATLSDAKTLDYQAGSETARSGFMAMMTGFDNISGAGALNVIGEMSPEKLIMDADLIDSLKRFAKGMEVDSETLAAEVIEQVGAGGNYLGSKHTRTYCRTQGHYDSLVMDVEDRGRWEKKGMPTILDRARAQVEKIKALPVATLPNHRAEALDKAFEDVCGDAGVKPEAGALMARCRYSG